MMACGQAWLARVRGAVRLARVVAAAVAAVAATAAAPSAVAAAADGAAVTLRHLLWDAAQKPLYQQCARDFERDHPGVRIRLQQQGWDDYWATLSTGFVAGTAPDVFTNHLTRFAEQVGNGVLLDLAPFVQRDAGRNAAGGVLPIGPALYEPGLYAGWSRGAAQYALPADWDTVALLVNLDLTRRAGVPDAQLQRLTWNPRDGGSFGALAARLTRDRAGRSALDAGFDPRQVLVRGYQVPGTGGMFGQSEWSHFAVSNGFAYQAAPWQAPLHYDSPALAETLDWLAGLGARGISATPEAMGKLGADAMFVTGRAAMVASGSWMLGYFQRSAHFAHAFVPLPLGPTGVRTSMRNGLAHSIWRGSRHADAAWLWLRHLGSPACQAVVARGGVVYPAVRGLAEVAAATQRAGGADPSAFLLMAAGSTFAPPIVDQSAQINDLIDAALEQVLLGRQRAAQALRPANAQANALLGR
jgi:multiple sugar transport system substrate-binding protein